MQAATVAGITGNDATEAVYAALKTVRQTLPLVLDKFWAPMAIAIAGGLFGATVLTLLVLPCMYAAWYRVKAS